MKLWMIGVLILLTLLLVGSTSAVIHVDGNDGQSLVDKMIDVDGQGNYTERQRISEDIIYRPSEDLELTLLRGGRLTVRVEQGQFAWATLDIKVVARIMIDGSELKLKGSVTGKIDSDHEVDLEGELKVKRDFEYSPSEKLRATLQKGGAVTVKVEQSKFTEATLNLRILSEIKIKGQWLKLKGTVSGKINAAFEVSFTGELDVQEDFTYRPTESVKVTLVKGGKVTAKVEKSKFKEATLDLTILAEITIKGEQLKLKGTIDGKIDGSFNVDMTGGLRVEEDFVYHRKGNVKVTFLRGGKVAIDIDKNKFQEADLNLTVAVDFTIRNYVLRLEGCATGRINNRFRVEKLKGRLTGVSIGRTGSQTPLWSWTVSSKWNYKTKRLTLTAP